MQSEKDQPEWDARQAAGDPNFATKLQHLRALQYTDVGPRLPPGPGRR